MCILFIRSLRRTAIASHWHDCQAKKEAFSVLYGRAHATQKIIPLNPPKTDPIKPSVGYDINSPKEMHVAIKPSLGQFSAVLAEKRWILGLVGGRLNGLLL